MPADVHATLAVKYRFWGKEDMVSTVSHPKEPSVVSGWMWMYEQGFLDSLDARHKTIWTRQMHQPAW